MSDAVQFSNLNDFAKEIEDYLSGSVQISIDPRISKGHIAYRANWNLKDAGDKVLTESNISDTVSAWCDSGGGWDEGANFLQDLSRQIKAEYGNQVLNDKKTEDKMKDLEFRLIRIREEHR